MTLIGLDIGTTSICGIQIDVFSGKIIDKVLEPNSSAVAGESPDESLQNPEIIRSVCISILEKFKANRGEIGGIGVTGQMHGILYVDEKGEACGPLYTWQDGRGERRHPSGLTYSSFVSETIGGSRVSTGMGIVTHFWNTLNGKVPENAASFCTTADYVAMSLAGTRKPLLDTTNAASLGCFDLEKKRFRLDAADKLGLNLSLFPETNTGYPLLGKGWNGAPVTVALGDNQASFLGAVRDIGRSVLVNIGTGSQISIYSDSIPHAEGIDVRPFPLKGYLLVGAGLCGGKSYSLLHDFFNRTVHLFTGGKFGADWEIMNRISQSSLGDANKLKVDPLFEGTRANPSLRGSISNLGVNNFTPEHLITGMREGMVNELLDSYDLFKDAGTGNIRNLIGSGNGIRLNPELAKTFEEKFGMNMLVPSHTEEASFGAALLAGVSCGVIPDLPAAGSFISYTHAGG